MTASMFSRLSKAQVDALNYVAFSGVAGGHRPSGKTASILVERGLIVGTKRSEPWPGLGTFVTTEYHMPIHVHMAWCAHVAKDDAVSA